MADTVLQVDHRPLYVRVREILVQRVSSGYWKPGQSLPNEFELADELGVSQGTVRKALDMLASEHLVVRRQGRGTFVAEHTSADIHFRFFHLHDADGCPAIPDSIGIKVEVDVARPAERKALRIDQGGSVIRIRRVRTVEGEPVIVERIVLPGDLFAGIEAIDPIPNTLYDLFQRRFGVTISGADEELTAIAASAQEAKLLKVAPGAPLLEINRTAMGVDGRRIEWRISRCLTTRLHYFSQLR